MDILGHLLEVIWTDHVLTDQLIPTGGDYKRGESEGVI